MQDLVFWVLTHGDKFLFWALTFAGGLLATLILKQLREGTAKTIVSRALTEVGDAVLAVSQTYVSALKAAAADGKLTAEEKAEAKAKAIAIVKQNLGMAGLKKLAKILGVDVDGWLGNKIEAAVGAAKAIQPVSATLKVGEIEAKAQTPSPQ